MRLHDMALVRQWHFSIAVAHKAHIKAAARADRWNRILGILAAAFSAIVGTALFTSLGKTQLEAWQKIGLGIVSVTAAVLTAWQTHLGLSETAELHRKSAGRYGTIRRHVEEILATYSDNNPCDDAQIDAINKTWSEIEATAPSLSQRLYAKLVRQAQKAEKLAQQSRRDAPPPPPPPPVVTAREADVQWRRYHGEPI
jgi:SMODS and SLOG-associating 2TM effector domain family 4